MTNHTPGPWEVWGGANSHCFDGVIRSSESPDAIAFVEIDDLKRDESGDIIGFTPSPDARLIASAPQLLEVLEEVALLPVARGYVDGPCVERELMDEVQAAIAKATGEEAFNE